jgi:hypothetical protein
MSLSQPGEIHDSATGNNNGNAAIYLPRYTGPQESHPLHGTRNRLSVAAMIIGLLPLPICSILGIILGFAAIRQIKERGQSGREFAIIGIVAGSIFSFIYLSLFA